MPPGSAGMCGDTHRHKDSPAVRMAVREKVQAPAERERTALRVSFSLKRPLHMNDKNSIIYSESLTSACAGG